MFDSSSRYASLPTRTYVAPDGREYVYVSRRIVPEPDAIPTASDAIVGPQDRLDLVAARALGDPEQYWRLCDVNGALNPFDLLRGPGQRVKVPGPFST